MTREKRNPARRRGLRKLAGEARPHLTLHAENPSVTLPSSGIQGAMRGGANA